MIGRGPLQTYVCIALSAMSILWGLVARTLTNTRTSEFALIERADAASKPHQMSCELLRCVCWLAKVVLLVHCDALQVSCIQGTPLYPVSGRTLQFFVM